MNLFIAILLIEVIFVIGNKVRYDNYKVYRVVPANNKQVKVLVELTDLNGGYSFWTEIAGAERPVDIMVAPHMDFDFRDAMNYNKIKTEVFINNVQTKIDNEKSKLKTAKGIFSNYLTLNQIYAYLNEMQLRFPDFVTIVNGGSTYQGRNITGVHISFDKANENRSVFFEAGIHAREWISTSTVLYLMNEILTSTNTSIHDTALAYDWYIFPSFNPDGYVYSHNSDRLWRKSRKQYGKCFGSDLNRNWDSHWGEYGASRNSCSELYAGSMAFSEVETKSMSYYISLIQHKLIAYITFHCYSQMLLIPYGYTSKHLENYNDLYAVGLKAAKSLAQRYETEYEVGNVVEIIYPASGLSMDWVKDSFKTPIIYTYELRDQGKHGFVLPDNQIIPTGEETLDSLLTIMTEFEQIL